ncbi:MAG TPA: hypothetical protein VFS56_00650 [Gemmatimonadaceae bacterium]|nr:hypothetical protein [Gemmatimonadaceae bacterium]
MKVSASASVFAALIVWPRVASGQAHGTHSDTAKPVAVGAQAIGVMTRQSPALGGRAFTEGYLTQPTLMAHARGRSNVASLQAMLSLEGWTLERGELNPGIVGEGYIDRRHPHTYLHELTGTVQHGVGRARGSLTIGKGFAPFGTDDPMVRPFVKYPINHHLAQILERIVAIAALSTGPLVIEAGAFNGDEPEGSGDAPNSRRLWDSWSARATILPTAGAEAQASFASVKSPEVAAGGGTDDRKWSVSARLESPHERRYALAEWARTTEYAGGSRAFSFSSYLLETESSAGRLVLAARLEVTERPDEERLADRFRTPPSGHDFSILGRSRWTIGTLKVAAPFSPGAGAGLAPFAELAFHRVRETLRPSAFVPDQFYGSDRIWTITLGARLTFGAVHQRMGRYGAAIPRRRGTNSRHHCTNIGCGTANSELPVLCRGCR